MAHSHPPVDVGEFASLPRQLLLITFSRLQIEKAEMAQQLQVLIGAHRLKGTAAPCPCILVELLELLNRNDVLRNLNPCG